MSKKARLGLILLAGLVLMVAHQPPEVKPIKLPTDLVIKQRHATWEQKRENQRIGRAYAEAGWGWRGREWLCLHDLWMAESRWDHLAQNPKSSAFGIAQLLRERSSRPELQVLRGLRYVAHRYGTPCKAWQFHQRKGHY